jgi:hypothetical protein
MAAKVSTVKRRQLIDQADRLRQASTQVHIAGLALRWQQDLKRCGVELAPGSSVRPTDELTGPLRRRTQYKRTAESKCQVRRISTTS